ncbi:MAG TPA: Stf0 family sulfotransferase [Acidimicrobiales bacterium]|jgi:LPS sulfotransferase NodH
MAYDLASAAFDLPDGDAEGGVRRSYLLCAMPRSGSSLLSEALAALGCLGTPIEYFDRTGAYAWLTERWGCPDLRAYVDLLHRRRRSAGGVFGAKVHWFQVRELAAGLGVDEPAAIRAVFPRCRFVYLHRRDRDRQAVSWAVARQTGWWSDGAGVYTGARPVPSYRFELVEECRRDLEAGEAAWRALFAAAGARPLEVAYEDLVASLGPSVAEVAAFLGERVDPAAVPPPRLRRQADGLSEEMVERYRADRRARTTTLDDSVPG